MQLALDLHAAGAVPVAGSGREPLRHSRRAAYGCSLPGLTGFTVPSRAGPDHQRCFPGAARSRKGRKRVLSPASRGFPVQGTPGPPPSTAVIRIREDSRPPFSLLGRRRRDLNPWILSDHTISNRADSAALARLRAGVYLAERTSPLPKGEDTSTYTHGPRWGTEAAITGSPRKRLWVQAHRGFKSHPHRSALQAFALRGDEPRRSCVATLRTPLRGPRW